MDRGIEAPSIDATIDTPEATALLVHEKIYKLAIKATSAGTSTLHATMHA